MTINNIKTWRQPSEIRQNQFYFISEILNANLEHPALEPQIKSFFWQYKQLICSYLQISPFDWDDHNRMKNYLSGIENYYKIDCDAAVTTSFNMIANRPPIFLNIQDLEQKIKQRVGNLFNFKAIMPVIDLSSTQQIGEKIVKFYNFLINSRLIPENNLIQLILYFTNKNLGSNQQRLDEDAEGIAFSFTLYNNVLSAIFLENGWYKNNLNQYLIGEYATEDNFGTFVHEFGHVICDFFNLNPTSKASHNSWYKRFKEPEIIINNIEQNLTLLFQNIYQSSPKQVQTKDFLYQMRDYFYRKFNNINSDWDFEQHFIRENDFYQKLVFTTLTAVPSRYGRSDFKIEDENTSSKFSNEWFAEGFAYWYLTPPERRNKIWQWWHEFLTEIVPLKFA